MCHIGLLLIVTKNFYTFKFFFDFLGLANDFSKNATKSVLYSTPKTKDICIQSSSKEVSQKGELNE